MLSRRSFLSAASLLSVACGAPWLLAACKAETPDVDAIYPQGLASGDPRPDGVLLWTRVEPSSPDGRENVTYDVAEDPDFQRIVKSGSVVADPASDHTVRVRLDGLRAGTTYFYRFRARDTSSGTGRTRTAPPPDADVPVRFAVTSCQDFVGRQYHAWRALGETALDVDFVLFAGDYIYEYTLGTNVGESDDVGTRTVDIPDGMDVMVEGVATRAAVTLADYRALYKRYKSDPYLKLVHALFPFVLMWDDHEFANDCWQDHANDFNGLQGDEKSPDRRKAASKAWFEFVPVDLAFDESAAFPNDLKTYRTQRWGKHLELALTDDRAYRSDSVIPIGTRDDAVGHIVANSPLGSRICAVKSVFDERERAANPTMLGQDQTKWLIDTLKGSNATWPIWVSGTMIAPMVLDLRAFDALPAAMRQIIYFKLDQWDGFRSERARILGQLAGVRNLIALSGDIHANYASHLHVDFDAPGATPVGCEFTVTGISSAPAQEQVQKLVDASPLLNAFGLSKIVPQFDDNLRATSPHITYAASNTHGLALVEVDGDRELRVELLEIDDVSASSSFTAPRSRRFAVPSGSPTITAR